MEILMRGKSTENTEYVRRLLKQKQPVFAAALELAVDLVERDFSACGDRISSGVSSPCCLLRGLVRPAPCRRGHR
jgi:hypothetical protein